MLISGVSFTCGGADNDVGIVRVIRRRCCEVQMAMG